MTNPTARLIPMITSMPRASPPIRPLTTKIAPNSPKTAPDAPTVPDAQLTVGWRAARPDVAADGSRSGRGR